MGDVAEFAAVIAVVTIAGLGWRWSNAWLQRLKMAHETDIDRLEQRIADLEARLGAGGPDAPRIAGGDEKTL